MVRVILLKANTEVQMVAIDNETNSLVLTYDQAYTVAFNLLYLLGMVRETKAEDEPRSITLYLPELSPEERDRILDPHRELVPDLETVIARLNRHPHP